MAQKHLFGALWDGTGAIRGRTCRPLTSPNYAATLCPGAESRGGLLQRVASGDVGLSPRGLGRQTEGRDRGVAHLTGGFRRGSSSCVGSPGSKKPWTGCLPDVAQSYAIGIGSSIGFPVLCQVLCAIPQYAPSCPPDFQSNRMKTHPHCPTCVLAPDQRQSARILPIEPGVHRTSGGNRAIYACGWTACPRCGGTAL